MFFFLINYHFSHFNITNNEFFMVYPWSIVSNNNKKYILNAAPCKISFHKHPHRILTQQGFQNNEQTIFNSYSIPNKILLYKFTQMNIFIKVNYIKCIYLFYCLNLQHKLNFKFKLFLKNQKIPPNICLNTIYTQS